MNGARLGELGFGLATRSEGGESEGAWFATAPDGEPVVLKWFPDEAMAARYALLLPALDQLRARGVPIPEYRRVLAVDGGTLSAQQILGGRSEDNPSTAAVEAMVDLIAAKADLDGPLPLPGRDSDSWGGFMTRMLTVGGIGWAMHEPLRVEGRRSAALLDRIQAIGAEADPTWFPHDGLVHLDLHTDNVLIDGDTVTGIIDWEGACLGDHRFDLVAFAFDLDGHDQPIWDVVDATGVEPTVLRSYLAFLALKCSDWAIRHHPGDVQRQLDRAERIFDRYEIR